MNRSALLVRGGRAGETLENAELLAEAAKMAGAIAGTVIGEHAGDSNAETGIVVDGSLEESGRRPRPGIASAGEQ